MNHWGKIIGASVGYLLAGIFGAGVGLVLGFFVDGFLTNHRPPRFTKMHTEDLNQIRSEFFDASFSVMGYVAQTAGRGTDAGASYALKVIKRMGLPEESRETAIALFNDGKAADFSLHKVVSQFYLDCRDQPNLLEMFLEIQLYAAFHNGLLSTSEKDIIQNIAYQLDFSAIEFDRVENLIRAECRQTTSTHKKKRQAEKRWSDKLAQDQLKQQKYREKHQRTQQKVQQKAHVVQRKEQVSQQRAQLAREKAEHRARQAQLRQQQKEQLARERAQQQSHQQAEYAYDTADTSGSEWSPYAATPLDDAYATLNMPHSASNDDIKKAYRRLTSKHHPDKLAAKDLPQETMKIAEVKTREIRAAYEHIREVRNF